MDVVDLDTDPVHINVSGLGAGARKNRVGALVRPALLLDLPGGAVTTSRRTGVATRAVAGAPPPGKRSRSPGEALQCCDPLGDGRNFCLPGEDLLGQHAMDLGVRVAASIGQDGQLVVHVGRQADRR